MELSTEKIRSLRKNRAWTQQQLADMCDLNLRTIQRIEKTGAASNESLNALASVFEVEREALLVVPRVSEDQLQPLRSVFPGLNIIIALCTGLAMGFLIAKLV